MVVTIPFSETMVLEANGSNLFRLTGHVPPGMPPFSVEAQPGNATANIPEVPADSFFDMVHSLGFVIVFINALLENMSVCTAFSKGKPMDITLEMIAIGVANIANSLLSSDLWPGV